MSRNGWKTFGHFLSRFVGLTGLLIVGAGVVIWREFGEEAAWMVVVIGGVMAALGLVVEVVGLFGLMLSRRGAAGSNVALQVALALALLIGVNWFSFFHHQRFDWTTGHPPGSGPEFTLEEKLRTELSKLRGETTIVVFQGYAAVGPQEKPDHYAAAADRKIIEKVHDLVEQFQELGPTFSVKHLDINDHNFQDNLNALKKKSEALGQAIENAPENSIFFYSTSEAGERIQRLGFRDVYQLDKKASEEEKNLVLKYQGAGPFARKILNIEEKRPRIAVAVVTAGDGLDSRGRWGMSGAKKALAARGFDSQDVILVDRRGFSVLSHDENKHERNQAQLAALDVSIGRLDKVFKSWTAQHADFQGPLAEVNKKYGLVPVAVEGVVVLDVRERTEIAELKKKLPRLPVSNVSEEFRREHLESLKENLEGLGLSLKQAEKRRAKLQQEKATLNPEELAEKRRIKNLRAKFGRMLEDCDLIVLPRLTLSNVAANFGPQGQGRERVNWSYATYRLDDDQVEAIRDFLKAGKPALFLLGPPQNEDDSTDDKVDALLGDLGIRLGRDSVFHDVDAELLAELLASPGADQREPESDVPSVAIDWDRGVGLLRGQVKDATGERHAVRTSVGLNARLGNKESLGFGLRHARPVYVTRFVVPPENAASMAAMTAGAGTLPALTMLPLRGSDRIDEKAIFLLSGADCWNEGKPMAEGNRIPEFERPKGNDPDRGTLKERRRGPFPIAAAVEARVPASWYGDDDKGKNDKGKGERKGERPMVRVAVIGHGGAFIGTSLSPGQDRLLLDTCNWLLGRDDLVARDANTWKYPRASLDPSEVALWRWGTGLGLPLLFAYLGMMMLLVRRMR